jgi:N-acetyl-anhydromuramyl-L-alanine amidase AmpD
MRNITKFIVHCSASDDPKDDSIEAIYNLHTAPKEEPIKWGEYDTHGKGWSNVGYHFFIEKSGTIKKGRDIDKFGAHCKGYNKESIGICLSGNEKFKGDQFISLTRLLQSLATLFPESTTHGHNEFSNKTCPNFDLTPYKTI